MKRAGVILGVLGVALASGCAHRPESAAAPGVTWVADGKALVTVVVAEDAPPSTRHAAAELQHFIGAMSGAAIPLAHAAPAEAGPVVFVGAAPGAPAVDLAGLGGESYVLRTVDDDLVIAGGEPRGTLYGVYALLEDHLGCRWYTPDVSHIPSAATLRVPVLDETHTPVLEYREPFVKDCQDGDWAARNRMNSFAAQLEEKHGGKVMYHGFVHTFDTLVPPSEYFDTHPEYFALVKGKRLKERTQLCCTNEDVIRIVTEGVQRWMREHPEATVFSVSQNDWYNYCECDRCQAMATAEDSQIAPVLALVNHVAGVVAEEFPDKVVDTLAYQWTRKPPKTMRPAPNVVVRLCSIECCFSHPFTECDDKDNVEFVKDVEGWSKQCDRLWVWNYDTSFANYFVPFPNLRVRGPNTEFFVKNNVTGIFEQDVYTTLNGEFSALSGYLGAKLLWDPSRDPEPIIDEFLSGVYGAAAPYLRRYLNLIHDYVDDNNLHVKIWCGPEDEHLTDSLLAQASALFNEAEAAVSEYPEVLERVRVARLSVDYSLIERKRNRAEDTFIIDHATYTIRFDPAFRAQVERFFAVAEDNGVTSIRENGGDLQVYKALFSSMLESKALLPMTPAKVSGLVPGLAYAYYDKGWDLQPDLKKETPAAIGTTDRIGLAAAPTPLKSALRFTGYFHAPANGVYSFGVRSNDGSLLYLGDTLIVDNGEQHGPQTRMGFAALRAGYYPITVEYFDAGGDQVLEAHVTGPGLPRRPLADSLLWRQPN
jgi:hypothetical protein